MYISKATYFKYNCKDNRTKISISFINFLPIDQWWMISWPITKIFILDMLDNSLKNNGQKRTVGPRFCENLTLIANIRSKAGRWTIRSLDGSTYLNNGGLLSRTKAEFYQCRGGGDGHPRKDADAISLLMDSFNSSCRLKIDRLQLN